LPAASTARTPNAKTIGGGTGIAWLVPVTSAICRPLAWIW
jgi:hypothetical protein